MFTIFSQRLAGYLMQRGFVLVGVAKASDHDFRNVFKFKKSDELLKAIEEYKEETK